MCMEVAVPAPILTATCALSMREKLQVPVGWCSSGLSAKEYEYTPGAGQPVWWLYACTWLKYLPFCSLKRSWPLSTSLKVLRGPTASSVNSAVEPPVPMERRGEPYREVATRQLPSTADTLDSRVMLLVSVVKFHRDDAAAVLEKHHASSFTGWL